MFEKEVISNARHAGPTYGGNVASTTINKEIARAKNQRIQNADSKRIVKIQNISYLFTQAQKGTTRWRLGTLGALMDRVRHALSAAL